MPNWISGGVLRSSHFVPVPASVFAHHRARARVHGTVMQHLQESLHGRFRVIQPGSTVATSLVDGEAEPKHLAILELKDQQFRLTTHRIQSVRPFVTDDVRLDDEEYGLDPDDVKVEEAIDRVLEEHVQNLITRARRERTDALASQTESIPPNRLCIMQEPNQVLLRIKVRLSERSQPRPRRQTAHNRRSKNVAVSRF